MNSDDIMSDPAVPANTPSEKPGAAAWNTKKFRDEYEAYKNRLQDQKFSVGESCFPTTAYSERYQNDHNANKRTQTSRLPRPACAAAAPSQEVPQRYWT
jgi:hypothetical protein